MTNKTQVKLSSAEISRLLDQLNQSGGFSMSVLTGNQGFPIASSSTNGQDPDRQAAVIAKVQNTLQQVSAHIGMGQTDELCIFDTDGHKMVSRNFAVKNHELILAVQIPDRKKTHRGLMNKLIRHIQKNWMI